MKNSSTVEALRNRVQERISQERESIEDATSAELTKLQSALSEQYKAAQSTIETTIRDQCRTLDQEIERLIGKKTKLLRAKNRIWTKALFLSILALTLFFGGHLAMVQLRPVIFNDIALQEKSNRIKAEIRTTEARLQTAQAELKEIREQSWGIALNENENGRFILLPPGWIANTGWEAGGRKAIKIERSQ